MTDVTGTGGVFAVERGRTDPDTLRRGVDLVLDLLRHPADDPDGALGLPRTDVVDLAPLTGLPPVRLARIPDAAGLLDLDLSWVEVHVLDAGPAPQPLLVAVVAPALGGGLGPDGARAFLDHVLLPAVRAVVGDDGLRRREGGRNAARQLLGTALKPGR